MNLVQIKETGAFGIIVSKDFNEAALFAFKRQNACKCDDCKSEYMTSSEEIKKFTKQMVKSGRIEKKLLENGRVFEFSFEEYCTYYTCSNDRDELPLQIFLCMLFPNRKDILDYCMFSDNAKNTLFDNMIMFDEDDNKFKDMTVDEMIDVLFPKNVSNHGGN